MLTKPVSGIAGSKVGRKVSNRRMAMKTGRVNGRVVLGIAEPGEQRRVTMAA